MKYTYTAIFTPMEDHTGYYCRVPDLPSCITTGKDLTDAIAMITDAAAEWLIVAEDEHLDIKEPSSQSELEVPDGSLCSIICVDTVKQRAMDDTHAVRKNVSIPAWMDRLAHEKRLNLSQILQESLRVKLEA